jgi:hypothetical protein
MTSREPLRSGSFSHIADFIWITGTAFSVLLLLAVSLLILTSVWSPNVHKVQLTVLLAILCACLFNIRAQKFQLVMPSLIIELAFVAYWVGFVYVLDSSPNAEAIIKMFWTGKSDEAVHMLLSLQDSLLYPKTWVRLILGSSLAIPLLLLLLIYFVRGLVLVRR